MSFIHYKALNSSLQKAIYSNDITRQLQKLFNKLRPLHSNKTTRCSSDNENLNITHLVSCVMYKNLTIALREIVQNFD